jgi:hypothetical protein
MDSGRAWKAVQANAGGRGQSPRQTALFDPSGSGSVLLVWAWGMHQMVFAGMLHSIAALLGDIDG